MLMDQKRKSTIYTVHPVGWTHDRSEDAGKERMVYDL